MIDLIIGPKGSGKTKKIIDRSTDTIGLAKGNIIFLTATDRYAYEVKYSIRLINVKEYGICSDTGFISFLKGIIAGDNDIEYIFIDGIAKMVNSDLACMGEIFSDIKKLGENNGINFIITVSCEESALPDYFKNLMKSE